MPATVTDSIGGRRAPRRSAAGGDDVARALAAGALALAGLLPAACAAVLLVRRLTGGLPGGARPLGMLAVALAGVGFVVAADLLARRSAVPADGWLPGMAWQPFVARLALCCGVLALVPPWPWRGAWWPALAIGGAALAAAMPRARRHSVAAGSRIAAVRGGVPDDRSMPPASAPAVVAEAPSPRPAAAAGETLSQQLARFHRSESATDRIEGTLVVVIPPGERSAPAHVAFCPPFTRSPSITIAAVDAATEAQAQAVENLPWGARIECSLEEAAEEAVEVIVTFTADGPAATGRPCPTIPDSPGPRG